jgi:hypothetical protein
MTTVTVNGVMPNSGQPQSWWNDTGIDVHQGDEIVIDASNHVGSINPGFGSSFGPEGQVGNEPNKNWNASLAYRSGGTRCWFGSLIGKVGEDGTAFCVGETATETASASGRLYLAFNDGVNFMDNNGSWANIDVTVNKRELTLREKTYVLAITGETGSAFNDDDRAVIPHVLENRDSLPAPKPYSSPENAIGTSQVAPDIMNGAVGSTRTEQINNQYAYFAGGGNPGIQGFFDAADDFVRSGIGTDPTGGAIQFSHATSVANAGTIAQAINNCGQSVIEDIIEAASLDVIINGPSMVAGSTNLTVYINMNYTIPTAPSGAPSCP